MMNKQIFLIFVMSFLFCVTAFADVTSIEIAGGTVKIAKPNGQIQMVDEVIGIKGYLSQSDARVNVGLGKATKADLVEIRWPDRTVQRFRNVKADQILTVVKDAHPGKVS